MKNYSIFVSSSDSYADIWPIFFRLFKENWPEFDGEIVLNTEMLNYSYADLNIKCTQVGKLGSFGKVFRAGLNRVYNENVLIIMIDYIFMGKVDHQRVNDYYNFFEINNLDSICLSWQGYKNTIQSVHGDLVFVLPPEKNIMFSYQIAFWKKDTLKEMVLPHENPWMSEWFGSKRAEKMNIKLACPKESIQQPIPYDFAGCLHQGKWLSNAVDYLKYLKYDVDFRSRGFYINEYTSKIFKVKLKLRIWYTGVVGSYWDLLRR